MRRIANLHAGEAKTDARDAAIIAEAARSMPHTLRSLRMTGEQLAELTMLCGFDDDRPRKPRNVPHGCASGYKKRLRSSCRCQSKSTGWNVPG